MRYRFRFGRVLCMASHCFDVASHIVVRAPLSSCDVLPPTPGGAGPISQLMYRVATRQMPPHAISAPTIQNTTVRDFCAGEIGGMF
jgi:hypothetical protein